MTVQTILLSNEIIEDSWDFKGSNTQYSTHGMHTYLAAMIPPVARRLIEETVPKNGTILDPFCGGGAVLVESILNKIPAVGIDINPLAILISNAKTQYIAQNQLHNTYEIVISNAKKFTGDARQFPKNYKIEYWFKDYMNKPLTALIIQIEKIQDQQVRTFFETVFSATVRDVSLTYRNEQRLRRLEPKDFDRFKPDVFETFRKRSFDSMTRLNNLPKNASADVRLGSVLDLPFKNKEFTNIICSPPYGDERNGVPYSQFSKNMLIWLGHKREDLLNLKKISLGGTTQEKPEFESEYLTNELQHLTNTQTKMEAISYYNDYYKALTEMIRVTSHYISIVIGNRTLQARVINNGKITVEFMESLGANLEKEYKRNLPHKRLPQMGSHYGAEINKEDILIFSMN